MCGCRIVQLEQWFEHNFNNRVQACIQLHREVLAEYGISDDDLPRHDSVM